MSDTSHNVAAYSFTRTQSLVVQVKNLFLVQVQGLFLIQVQGTPRSTVDTLPGCREQEPGRSRCGGGVWPDPRHGPG